MCVCVCVCVCVCWLGGGGDWWLFFAVIFTSLLVKTLYCGLHKFKCII